MCNAAVDLLDSGGAGSLEILTSGDAVLATLTLPNPAFGNAVDGVATAEPIAAADATGDGVAAKYNLKSNAGTILFAGVASQGGGGGEVILTNTDINIGDPVSVVSLTVTVPAS
jgi:hypothetical protein